MGPIRRIWPRTKRTYGEAPNALNPRSGEASSANLGGQPREFLNGPGSHNGDVVPLDDPVKFGDFEEVQPLYGIPQIFFARLDMAQIVEFLEVLGEHRWVVDIQYAAMPRQQFGGHHSGLLIGPVGIEASGVVGMEYPDIAGFAIAITIATPSRLRNRIERAKRPQGHRKVQIDASLDTLGCNQQARHVPGQPRAGFL